MKKTDKSESNGHSRKLKAKRHSRKMDEVAEIKLSLLADLIPKLARAFAPICEVVLHDNSTLPPTIKAIGNGHVTSRKVGDSMTWNCPVFGEGDDEYGRKTPNFNYAAKLLNGTRLRCSLIPVVHEDEVIGYISISILVEGLEIAQQTLSALTEVESRVELNGKSFFSPREAVEKVVKNHLNKSSMPVAAWDKNQRIELIRELKEDGVFITRGAVDEVASILGVSRTAVYNYLNELE